MVQEQQVGTAKGRSHFFDPECYLPRLVTMRKRWRKAMVMVSIRAIVPITTTQGALSTSQALCWPLSHVTASALSNKLGT